MPRLGYLGGKKYAKTRSLSGEYGKLLRWLLKPIGHWPSKPYKHIDTLIHCLAADVLPKKASRVGILVPYSWMYSITHISIKATDTQLKLSFHTNLPGHVSTVWLLEGSIPCRNLDWAELVDMMVFRVMRVLPPIVEVVVLNLKALLDVEVWTIVRGPPNNWIVAGWWFWPSWKY